MNQLNEMVEEIVNSVWASEHRKNKMREELLQHLTEIYNEELAKGVKEDIAFKKALQRFGSPSVLRHDLQSSVPFLERVPQIVRSFIFTFVMMIGFWVMVYLILGKNVNINKPYLSFGIILGVSYLSRILPTRPRFNMTFQFLGLYIFDYFIAMFIEPRFQWMSVKMGLTVRPIWDSIFLLANIVLLLWIWMNFKHKEIHNPMSTQGNRFRNISSYSGTLGIFILTASCLRLIGEEFGQVLSFLLILNSIVFCSLSYWQGKTAQH